MDNLDIDRAMKLLDKYCSEGECAIMCKTRERLLKHDCVIARFIKYVEHQGDITKNRNID